ncbi:MAG TPA: hypothetical protein VE818_02230 [Nitrososphaeraceae archaeon]|jgi:hypothetical protein|nr:hypothetical protein [Nitrososphaeraceae archaeon]
MSVMQNIQRIPRWLIENDPSWEKSIDSNLANLKWIKKGTNLEATCSVTSMFCDILNESKENENVGLIDVSNNFINQRKLDALGINDLTRYLSSRYLNPIIDRSTDLGINRFNPYRLRKF